jgi:hypothetical protein
MFWVLYFAFATFCVFFAVNSKNEEIKGSTLVAKILYYHGIGFMIFLIFGAVLSFAIVGAQLIQKAMFGA